MRPGARRHGIWARICGSLFGGSAASRQLVIVVQLVVATIAAAAVGGPEVAVAVGVVLTAVFAMGARRWATIRSNTGDLVSS